MLGKRSDVATIPSDSRTKSSRHPDREAVARVAARQRGHVTLAQLEARGVSASRVKGLVVEGRLFRAFTGVLTLALREHRRVLG